MNTYRISIEQKEADDSWTEAVHGECADMQSLVNFIATCAPILLKNAEDKIVIERVMQPAIIKPMSTEEDECSTTT